MFISISLDDPPIMPGLKWLVNAIREILDLADLMIGLVNLANYTIEIPDI
jgi:hypothetical protein